MPRPTSRRSADARTARNRFAGGGVAVLGEDFTNREREREELARSARTPRGHVVVSGLRRMGRTSILLAVRDELVKSGHPALTALQQNVLRSVATESTGWARAAVLQQFALGSSSRVSQTIDALCERAILLRDGEQVVFDDPFYRAWVIVSTLPDVGLRLPITHRPTSLPNT